jgi:putative membrane protein
MSRRRSVIFIAFALCAIMPRFAFAHDVWIDDDAAGASAWWTNWGFEPGTVIGLVLTGILYDVGLKRTWDASGVGHGVSRREARLFLAGWLTLAVALVSPLHPLGEVLFSAHMIQHELLMLAAAPMLVLSRPVAATLRGMPRPLATSLARASNTRTWKRVWHAISNPFAAWTIHLVVLWAWHAPALFQSTLRSELAHAAQHVSFLGSALLFWWSLVHGSRGVVNHGVATLYLFTTAVHSGLLGALLTFARTPWYPAYDHTQSWGLSALEDQQLGGVIMWVPACTVYIVAGLALFAKWIGLSSDKVNIPTLRSATP